MPRRGFGEAEFQAIIVALRWNNVRARRCAGWSAGGSACVARFKASEEVVKAGEGFVDALSRVDDDKGLADIGIEDRSVFNHVIETPTIVTSFESQCFGHLVVDPERVFMLLVGF